MQAIECGLPIVDREGRFMRGRLASGILQQMGMQELVANNEENYISIAVRLIQESAYHQSVQEEIEAGRQVLFDDIVPIRALEEFLEKVVQE